MSFTAYTDLILVLSCLLGELARSLTLLTRISNNYGPHVGTRNKVLDILVSYLPGTRSNGVLLVSGNSAVYRSEERDFGHVSILIQRATQWMRC